VSAPSFPQTINRQRVGRATESENHRVALELRVMVALHRRRLDRALARGVVPTASRELGLRAEQLIYGSTRYHLAHSLREAVRDASSPRSYGTSPTVPVARGAVKRWGDELVGVADLLEQPGTVAACGVARALELVTDGGGPLYSRAPEQALGSALEAITEGLEVPTRSVV
jgi:hypothetical protein